MIYLNELVDPRELKRGMDQKLIAMRTHPDEPNLAIYNYTDAALYTPGAWENPAVRQCRGLITYRDQIVARPWAKFFNHGQAEAGDLDMTAPVEVTDKADGSLGIIYPAPDGYLAVATRGSFTSDQALHATDVLRERHGHYLNPPADLTVLVEIVYPQNRIVLDYGDLDDLIILGAVEDTTGYYYGAREAAELIQWDGPVTKTFPHETLADALAAPPRSNAEGLCVRYLDQSKIVKIKQDDYVRLHRIVTGLSERTVWQAMIDNTPLHEVLAPLPDELHDWTRTVWWGLRERTETIAQEAERLHGTILDDLPSRFERRDYAELAKARGRELKPHLFALLDGRDPRPKILYTLKPAGDTRARAMTEATA